MWQVLIRVFLAVRFRVSVPFGSTRLDLPQNCNSKWPTRWAQITDPFLCGVKWGSFFHQNDPVIRQFDLGSFLQLICNILVNWVFSSPKFGVKKKKHIWNHQRSVGVYLTYSRRNNTIRPLEISWNQPGTLRAHGDATFAKLRQLLAALPNVQMPAKGSKGMSSRMLRFSKNGYIHHPKNIH